MYMFSFIRNCHLIFQRGCVILHFYHQCVRDPFFCFAALSAFLIISCFLFAVLIFMPMSCASFCILWWLITLDYVSHTFLLCHVYGNTCSVFCLFYLPDLFCPFILPDCSILFILLTRSFVAHFQSWLKSWRLLNTS